MKKWCIEYYIRNKNLYTCKYVYAKDNMEAIKKARVKNIEDLYIVNEKNERIEVK